MAITRMEAHALRRRRSAIPGTGPLLSFDELDDDESAIISRELLESLKETNPQSQRDYYAALHEILVHYGVMCTHPVELRLYEGFWRARKQVKPKESKWFRCEMCDCLVINR